ncbi:MAG: amidohydrolase family protein [Hydrogenoanaerobacterium sp.]
MKEETAMQENSSQKMYKIADAHTHIYPGKIAEKATENVGSFYGVPMKNIGYPHSLLESGSKINVLKYLVCSVATTPRQVSSINNFIVEKCKKYERFMGFATLHPLQEDWESELERIVQLGLRGVKFHPDFQHFNIDDSTMLPVYKKISQAKLPILFHIGDERYDFSSPKRLYNVLQKLPELTCIAAHFGGYCRWEDAARYLLCDNLYFDTSSSLWKLTNDEATGLIHHFGAEKFMFGTDYPMWSHAEELERFLKLKLSDAENERILHGTFEELFEITL